MAKKMVQAFRNGDDRYVAIGKGTEGMDVFRLSVGYRTKMGFMFPTCLKFMPEAEPQGDMVELDDDVIEQIYGEAVKPGQQPRVLTEEDDG